MGVEQHLVALARIRHQPERTAGAELQVRHLHAPVNAADQQAFLAPVKLKRLTQRKAQRHRGLQRLTLFPAPDADKRGELAVATVVPLGLDLRQQRLGTAPLLLGAQLIGLQRLLQRGVIRAEFVEDRAALVNRLLRLGCSNPLANRVARQQVRLAILCSDSLSRKYIRRILPIISILITLCSHAQKLSRSS